MSPHPILVPFVEQTAETNGVAAVVVGSTRREEPEVETALTSLGQFYVHGGALDWSAFYPCGNLVPLPAYPWQRQRYWIESSGAAPVLRAPAAAATAEVEPRANGGRAAKPFLAAWKELEPKERPSALTQWVREQVAAVLRSRSDRVDVHQPLKSLGVNSLMTLELRNRMEKGLGIAIAAGAAWSYPTVAALAEFLQGRLTEQNSGEGPRAQSKPKSVMSAAELLEAELSGAEMELDRRGL
jgi:acyl transferase domain-containing protein